MDNQWKEEECSFCYFEINGICRKNPPTCIVFEGKNVIVYPTVGARMPACSYWREK